MSARETKIDASRDATLNGVVVDGETISWAEAFDRSYMTSAWYDSVRPVYDEATAR